MDSLHQSVSSVSDFIPTVEYSCKSFTKELESTYVKYNQSKKALKYHSQVLLVGFCYIAIGVARDASADGYLSS